MKETARSSTLLGVCSTSLVNCDQETGGRVHLHIVSRRSQHKTLNHNRDTSRSACMTNAKHNVVLFLLVWNFCQKPWRKESMTMKNWPTNHESSEVMSTSSLKLLNGRSQELHPCSFNPKATVPPAYLLPHQLYPGDWDWSRTIWQTRKCQSIANVLFIPGVTLQVEPGRPSTGTAGCSDQGKQWPQKKTCMKERWWSENSTGQCNLWGGGHFALFTRKLFNYGPCALCQRKKRILTHYSGWNLTLNKDSFLPE